MNCSLKSEEHQIYLRDIEITDAEFLMELNNDPAISHFVVGTPKEVTLQEQLQWLEKIKFETNCKRFIIVAGDKTVGTVIISNIDNTNSIANISIKLHKTAHGKGIAKISIGLIVDYCFKNLCLSCLTAHVLTYNKSSISLFNRCGFTNEGVLRSRVIKEGNRCDLVSFSITKNDFYSF